MAKKLAKVKTKTAPTNDADLRRWCIEQAIHWPWDAGSLGYSAGVAQMGCPSSQPDILKRAAEIFQWVKSAA